LLLLAVPAVAGCGDAVGRPDLVWGKKGVRDCCFVRPRAAVIDRNDRLFIVDFTARIQAFDLDGKHLAITWTTPDYRNGRVIPCRVARQQGPTLFRPARRP
jgi:hypothetical protein